MDKKPKTDPEETEQESKQKEREFSPKKERLCKILTEFNAQIKKSQSNTEGWHAKIRNALRRRKGLIGKKKPDIPFQNSSDLRMRLEEIVLTEMNADFIALVRTSTKIARYVPEDGKNSMLADDLEYFTQYQLQEDAELNRKWELLINKRNECVGVAKIIWEHHVQPQTKTFSRRELAQKTAHVLARKIQMAQAQRVPMASGMMDLSEEEFRAALADEFGFDLEDKLHQKRLDSVMRQWEDEETEVIRVIIEETTVNRPSIIPITDLSSLTVPENTTCLQQAEWISHDRDYSERELLQSRNKFKNVDKLLEAVKSAVKQDQRTEYRQVIETAAGLSGAGSLEGYITIRELYCYLPRSDIAAWNGMTDEDDTPVKCVINYAPDVSPEDVPPLRVMEFGYEYPNFHLRWPFEEDVFNLAEDRYYASEGIGMLIEPFSKEMDARYNAARDREAITLSPPTLVWSQAKISTQAFRQVGQVMQSAVPVTDGVIKIPQYPDLSAKLDQTVEGLMSYARQLAGANTAPAINYGQPPSAQEVQYRAAPGQSIRAAQLGAFSNFIGRILRHIHDLNAQFLFPMSKPGGSVTVPKMDGQKGETATVTPAHFQAKYMILCGADIARGNPMFETQKLVAFEQMMNSDPANAIFLKPYDMKHLLATQMIGHINTQTVFQEREKSDQLNQQFLQIKAQAKAQMEEQKNKSLSRGNKPTGRGGMKEIVGAQQGIFPRSVGT